MMRNRPSVGLLVALLLALLSAQSEALPTPAESEGAHIEIWSRFVDRNGILLDFTGLDGKVPRPTPAECRAGKPNALGWFQPAENGAMFTGLYLDAALNRWRLTQSTEDAEKARRLMRGLIRLNSVSRVKGFIARGISSDGHSHFPMGSNDQTLPWLLGLWQYLNSGVASSDEKVEISGRLTDTIQALITNLWRMPAEEPFGSRGSFAGHHFDDVTRMLLSLKILAALTGNSEWESNYRAELRRTVGPQALTKRTICQNGMSFFYAKTHNWTSCGSVAALRALWEMESDEDLRAAYAEGLRKSAELAAESIELCDRFDPAIPSRFNVDWRASMLPLWHSQSTEQEAVDLALLQLKEFAKTSPGRNREAAFIREGTSAAWIVTLDPDPARVAKHATTIRRIAATLPYPQLHCSTFFWIEAACLRLAVTTSPAQ
jgi:hypothetical protein